MALLAIPDKNFAVQYFSPPSGTCMSLKCTPKNPTLWGSPFSKPSSISFQVGLYISNN